MAWAQDSQGEPHQGTVSNEPLNMAWAAQYLGSRASVQVPLRRDPVKVKPTLD